MDNQDHDRAYRRDKQALQVESGDPDASALKMMLPTNAPTMPRTMSSAQGDALELLEVAEEVLDQVALIVRFGVDLQRGGAARML
jgi:hypothetical protein